MYIRKRSLLSGLKKQYGGADVNCPNKHLFPPAAGRMAVAPSRERWWSQCAVTGRVPLGGRRGVGVLRYVVCCGVRGCVVLCAVVLRHNGVAGGGVWWCEVLHGVLWRSVVWYWEGYSVLCGIVRCDMMCSEVVCDDCDVAGCDVQS